MLRWNDQSFIRSIYSNSQSQKVFQDFLAVSELAMFSSKAKSFKIELFRLAVIKGLLHVLMVIMPLLPLKQRLIISWFILILAWSPFSFADFPCRKMLNKHLTYTM
jgi:hypothetical protein